MWTPRKTGSPATRRLFARLKAGVPQLKRVPSRPCFPAPVALARLTLFALCALLVLPCPLARAVEVEFYAVADRETVPIDETISLTVTISHDAGARGETLILPEVAPDFQVLSKKNSEQTSFQMTGSGPPTFRKVRVYRFILSPTRTGKLQIPAGKLLLDNRNYETAPIQITVTGARGSANTGKAGKDSRQQRRQSGSSSTAPGPSAPPPMPDPFTGGGMGGLDELLGAEELEELENLFGMGMGGGRNRRRGQGPQDSDIFLRTVLDKKKAYVGEQITMSLLLYARTDVSGVNNMKLPKLDGFWSEDLETPSQITGERRVIDGVAYRVFLLRRKALFPLKAGKLTIDQVEAEISMSMGFFFSGGRRVQRKSAPVEVEILPLPLNPPKGFESTNVGSWRLSAEASPERVPLNQPITLRLTLEGKGNLRNISLPPLPDIPGLKAYEPTTSERLSTSRNLFGGRRTFEYLLMPTKTGAFTLPAFQLVFFDPAQKKYRTAKTSPIKLRVDAGTSAAPLALGPGAAAIAQPGDQAVNVLDASGLKPLRYKGVLKRPQKPLHLRPWFIPLVLSPFFVWLLIGLIHIGRRAFSGSGAANRGKGAGRRLKARLSKAEKLLKAGDADAFYAEIASALGAYLSDKLARASAGMTRPEIRGALSDMGAPPEVLDALEALLDTCDAGRFAPGSTEAATMQKVRDDALNTMQRLEALKLEAGRSDAQTAARGAKT